MTNGLILLVLGVSLFHIGISNPHNKACVITGSAGIVVIAGAVLQIIWEAFR